MSDNKLPVEYDPAEWQWQDRQGQVFRLSELTRDDLLQVVCTCMDVIAQAEEAAAVQINIFDAWRRGDHARSEADSG